MHAPSTFPHLLGNHKLRPIGLHCAICSNIQPNSNLKTAICHLIIQYSLFCKCACTICPQSQRPWTSWLLNCYICPRILYSGTWLNYHWCLIHISTILHVSFHCSSLATTTGPSSSDSSSMNHIIVSPFHMVCNCVLLLGSANFYLMGVWLHHESSNIILPFTTGDLTKVLGASVARFLMHPCGQGVA